MKKIAEYKVTVNRQKVQDESLLREVVVADSIAEELIMQGKEFDPKAMPKDRIEIVKIWKPVEEKKKASKKEEKKEEKK